MSSYEAHNAISQRISEIPFPIRWVNAAVEPAQDDEYIDALILPLSVRAPFVSETSQRTIAGLIELNCYTVKGIGMGRAFEVADIAGSYFARDHMITIPSGIIRFPVGALPLAPRVATSAGRAAITVHIRYEVTM